MAGQCCLRGCSYFATRRVAFLAARFRFNQRFHCALANPFL
jgi:hypothetical protein